MTALLLVLAVMIGVAVFDLIHDLIQAWCRVKEEEPGRIEYLHVSDTVWRAS